MQKPIANTYSFPRYAGVIAFGTQMCESLRPFPRYAGVIVILSNQGGDTMAFPRYAGVIVVYEVVPKITLAPFPATRGLSLLLAVL